jgi:osmotically-inducible protein OsmY
MRRFQTWVLLAALLAAIPGTTAAGLPSFLKFFGGGSEAETPPTAEQTKAYNTKMAESIASALRAAGLSGYDIRIRFQANKAELTGSIADAGQKAAVTRVVTGVEGVGTIDNQLKVMPARTAEATKPSLKPSLKPEIKPATFAATPKVNPADKVANQKMAEQIARALGAAQLSSYDIEIRFRQGIAQLAGTVNSLQERAYVEQIAASVPGVKRVENQLALGRRPAGLQQAAYQQAPPGPGPGPVPGPPGPPGAAGPSMPPPPSYGHPGGRASNTVYNMPNMPNYAWPSYAAYPNSSQISYPKQYSASAWPYIGPFYPYPQIPMGWRAAQLEWDDGHWNLNFRPRTDKWWWFMNPENW